MGESTQNEPLVFASAILSGFEGAGLCRHQNSGKSSIWNQVSSTLPCALGGTAAVVFTCMFACRRLYCSVVDAIPLCFEHGRRPVLHTQIRLLLLNSICALLCVVRLSDHRRFSCLCALAQRLSVWQPTAQRITSCCPLSQIGANRLNRCCHAISPFLRLKP